MADPATRRSSRPREPLRELDPADFPGCETVEMSAAELGDYEGRVEYWEARTGTAMIVAEVTAYHEIPANRITGLVEMISQARGSETLALGSVALVQYDEHGNFEILMEADATFYLDRPWPKEKRIDIDAGPLPDVVLEVDHTTDVRRRKLEVYESWGFPEVWVERPSPKWLAPRETGRPRLVIYLLEGGSYVESTSSRAFPGWTAEEIHRALNEEVRSEATVAALRRVGRRMGRSSGTGPDDDLFLAAERAESRAQGREEGRAQGREEGRLAVTRCLVRQTLEARGIPITAGIDASLAGLETADAARLMRAAAECLDEHDFLRRVAGKTDASA
ncbi:MAG: Uma2 family endonuclease [Acidobacteriota bacterium]|nr:Uma2 family endonuclease [Acidobacteriota bacterium]MDE3265782.1 Uma2 family endonuclease [Acidobacteriota bacterium]